MCAYQGVRNVSFRKILRTYLMDGPLLMSRETVQSKNGRFKVMSFSALQGIFLERNRHAHWKSNYRKSLSHI